MTWEIKMTLNGWRRTPDGWRYHRRIAGRRVVIPAWQADVWRAWALVPTMRGVKAL